jgi:beta-lactamase superfamily II metal-dependent hydrolase
MSELKIWFLDVGHGDCAYIELPNGARMMIDCGCSDAHWPSKLLKHYKLTKGEKPAPIPNHPTGYAIDQMVITHPHGDHISDIEAIHDDIGFFMLSGGYKEFIDRIAIEKIDFRKRGQEAAKKFVSVVKKYTGEYVKGEDRIALAAPACVVNKKRFVAYEDDIDLNDISWLVSFEIATHKILFAGDLTAAAVKRILATDKASAFKEFVKGTTILKIPHHGRENGCSQEMFDAFGVKPLLCIASDEILNNRNEGTSNIQWYTNRASDEMVNIDGTPQNRKVLTTRKDKDIYLQLSTEGDLHVSTNVFNEIKPQILDRN